MQTGTILVIGSSNMDMIVKSSSLPQPGETVIGGAFSMAPGGKGANQAVAAARIGGRVAFLTCLGDDDFGQSLRGTYNRERIDTGLIQQIEQAHTGIAFILVDSEGRNMISVASGANGLFSPDRLAVLKTIENPPEWVLLQLEIPVETVTVAAKWAQKQGAKVVLDPAPVPQGGLPPELLERVDILTPNEVEAGHLAGCSVQSPEDARAAGQKLVDRGCSEVIVTMGERGGVCVSDSDNWSYAAERVHAVDSTAAGDCFTAALVVALAEGVSRREAVDFAAAAAAFSVTRMGALSSLPRREDL